MNEEDRIARFEAVKRLRALDPDRFADPAWQYAARFRDLIAHHDEEIDHDGVWRIATVRMPVLEAMLDGSSLPLTTNRHFRPVVEPPRNGIGSLTATLTLCATARS